MKNKATFLTLSLMILFSNPAMAEEAGTSKAEIAAQAGTALSGLTSVYLVSDAMADKATFKSPEFQKLLTLEAEQKAANNEWRMLLEIRERLKLNPEVDQNKIKALTEVAKDAMRKDALKGREYFEAVYLQNGKVEKLENKLQKRVGENLTEEMASHMKKAKLLLKITGGATAAGSAILYSDLENTSSDVVESKDFNPKRSPAFTGEVNLAPEAKKAE